jgi:thiamine-monophosphate kinase
LSKEPSFDEIDILKLFRSNATNSSFLNGIGDDAAVIKIKNQKLAVSCDSQINNVHFKLEFSTISQIAFRAVSVALSDLAAMGANPLFFINSLHIPKGFSKKEIALIKKGFTSAEERFNIQLIGGNVTYSKVFAIDVTVIGSLDSYISRGSLRDEKIYVSGNIGSANAGLNLLRMKKLDKELVQKYRTPIPRLELAKRLSSKGFLSSMIDITDGLAIDLERLVKFKRKTLGAQIIWSSIPKSLSLEKHFSKKKIFEMVLFGGDDYELLFTVKKDKQGNFENYVKNNNLSVFEIGTTNVTGDIFIYKNGKNIRIKNGGYVHKF